MVRATIKEHFPLTAGKGDYTIGIGQDFNTSKPIKIVGGFIRDGNNMDSGLDIITEDIYDSYQDKSISLARPVALFYDPGLTQQSVQTGTIRLYYIPDDSTSYTLYIDETKPFSDISSILNQVTFEPPYEEAIIFELAIRLWPEYHEVKVPVSKDLYMLANEAMHTVETMNSVQLISSMELPGSGGPIYNIYIGGYND